MDPRHLSSKLSVSPQLSLTDLAAAKAAGFKTLINNRPDADTADQPGSAQLAAEAANQGLSYHHLPVVGGAITDTQVDAFRTLLTEAEGPILAFCRSGTRCTVLWALSQVGERSPETLVHQAAQAGYDLNGLLPELLHRWSDHHQQS